MLTLVTQAEVRTAMDEALAQKLVECRPHSKATLTFRGCSRETDLYCGA
jgi:hypothetical protein